MQGNINPAQNYAFSLECINITRIIMFKRDPLKVGEGGTNHIKYAIINNYVKKGRINLC